MGFESNKLIRARRELQKEREETRKALRDAVEGQVQLQYIGEAIQALEKGVENIEVDGVEVERVLDKTRVAAINAALNARFRLLAKVLPDLKAIELDLGAETMGAMRGYTELERAARVAFLLKRGREAGAGPAAEGDDADMDAAPGSADPSFLQ